MRKFILRNYFFGIFLVAIGCHTNESPNQKSISALDSIISIEDTMINCFELYGEFPDLAFHSDKYFGRIFLQATYDTSLQMFSRFTVARSHVQFKSDNTVFSNYDDDSKGTPPELYNAVIATTKSRLHNSNFRFRRISTDQNCFNNNWLTLKIEVK